MKSLYFLACIYFVAPVFSAKVGFEGSYEKMFPLQKEKLEQVGACNESNNPLIAVALGNECNISYQGKKKSDDQAVQSIAN